MIDGTACPTDKKLPEPPNTFYANRGKRWIDCLLSCVALIVLSPFLLVICILQLTFHGRPIVYKTLRPGLNGELFTLYKFRSMTNERDEDGLLLPEERRLTSFGRFLRKTSIDELPSLVNIAKGDMAIIGPRPLLREYLDLYSARHACRHKVRPGLACVRLNEEAATSAATWTWGDQFENDIYYVEHVSFFMDVKMIKAVASEALRGSKYRADDTRVPFDGENLSEKRSKLECESFVRHESILR